MTSVFSPIPRVIFTVIEPLLVIGGAVTPFLDPASFVNDQLPNAQGIPLTTNSHVLALQLGNIYGLLGMIQLAIFYTTTEPKVVRNYIIALWLADISHIGLTAYFLGLDATLDVKNWNYMAWGNIGVTSLLFLARTAWLFGLFGRDKNPVRLRRSLPNQRKNH